MDKEDIPFLSVMELSQLIGAKEVSPVEATEAYLDRIDDLDFKFNAYLTILRKGALQAAREAERAIAQGNYLGPMHGVPVAVKDQFWTKGIRTTGGSRILSDFIPEADATVISNLKSSGAILLGKTNQTDFAMGGYSQRYSTPRNPWNLDMYTGASSGGSAAATAAFLCATSLGEDTGGSIRLPGAWCGLVGLRPSWGRVSRYGVMRAVWSMDAVGPLSRTVSDCAMTLRAIAGHDSKDPYTWDTPVPDYKRALDGDIKDMRIGLITEQINSYGVVPQVREAVLKAILVLGELGASVEEVSLPLTQHVRLITSVILAVEPAASNHREWIRSRLREYGTGNRTMLVTGSIMPAQVYYKAQKLRSMLRHEVLSAMQKYDVLVLPTLGTHALRIQGDDPVITPSKQTSAIADFMLTGTFNLVNAPAITVPCGLSSEKLPIGLQIGGGDPARTRPSSRWPTLTSRPRPGTRCDLPPLEAHPLRPMESGSIAAPLSGRRPARRS